KSRRFSLMLMLSSSGLRRALDRAQDADVGAAAALESGQRVADLGVARTRIPVEQRYRVHHPAIETVAALRHLLFDERRLHFVRLVRRADARQRGDPAC